MLKHLMKKSKTIYTQIQTHKRRQEPDTQWQATFTKWQTSYKQIQHQFKNVFQKPNKKIKT